MHLLLLPAALLAHVTSFCDVILSPFFGACANPPACVCARDVSADTGRVNFFRMTTTSSRNATARAIRAIISKAPETDLEHLLLHVEDAIGDRKYALEREQVDTLRATMVVPLQTVVHVMSDDAKLSSLRISQVLADCVKAWQAEHEVHLALVSSTYIEEHDLCELRSNVRPKTPHTSVAVAFVPSGPVVDLTRIRASPCKSYNDLQQGMNWAGESRDDDRYDMFIMSVLIQIEEHHNHPRLDKKRSREDA